MWKGRKFQAVFVGASSWAPLDILQTHLHPFSSSCVQEALFSSEQEARGWSENEFSRVWSRIVLETWRLCSSSEIHQVQIYSLSNKGDFSYLFAVWAKPDIKHWLKAVAQNIMQIVPNNRKNVKFLVSGEKDLNPNLRFFENLLLCTFYFYFYYSH